MPLRTTMAADVGRGADAVDPVDGDDRVGRFEGDARPGRPHRDAGVRDRERRRAVDSVSDDDHGAQFRVSTDGADDLEPVLGV